jgi:hypothetical protein
MISKTTIRIWFKLTVIKAKMKIWIPKGQLRVFIAAAEKSAAERC